MKGRAFRWMVALATVASITASFGHVQASSHMRSSDPNTIVIGFEDVTSSSNCKIGYGHTEAEASVYRLSCPVGSVIVQRPLKRAEAEAKGLPYVTPVYLSDGTTVDNATTSAAVQAKLESLFAQHQQNRSAIVMPNTACAVSPAYQKMQYGNGGVSFEGEARWYEQIVGGQCVFNNVNDHIRQTGGGSFVEKWNKSAINTTDPATGVDRGCQTVPYGPNFNGWQGGLGTGQPNGQWLQQVDQTTGSCGNIFDTYIGANTQLIQQ